MFDTPNMEGGKEVQKRGNDEGGYSYDSFSKKGGAKGKPGKRSRMANHDDRDLDGFRDERRGGGRVRKYNDRNGGKAWQLGYPRNKPTRAASSTTSAAAAAHAARKYADKQYSDGRGSKPGKKNYGNGGRGNNRSNGFGGKGFGDRPSNGGGRPGNGGHSDGFQRSGKSGAGRNNGRNVGGRGGNNRGGNFGGGRSMATTVAARAAIVPVAADVAKQGRDRFFFPQIHERAGQTTSPFFIPQTRP